MSHRLDTAGKIKRIKMKYNRENLKKAFNATLEGVSVYRAAKVYNVPESTLRDRTLGIVPIDVSIGFTPIFNKDEEEKLVAHIKYMADVGYGYNKRGVQSLAREYAASLGKDLTRQKSNSSTLSNCWFYGFLQRWPDLKVASPQKLTTCRAEAASRDKLNSYYKELSSIMTRHSIRQTPEQIYNIDETGISTEHNPPKIICSKSTKPQAITSARSSLTTIIAAGNAIGNHLPPFYVFKGKRWSDDLLRGSVPGAEGIMTETGWSNTKVFEKYLTEFFAKHTGIQDNRNQKPVLVLYDGHKSHVSLTLTDWAKRHNVILFVLPPHTSHLTQPLDVAIFGPLKSMYNKECQMFLQRNPGTSITKHLVAELTAKPYLRALSPENLISAFKKTGIYPFNNKAISNSEVAPSTIYNEDKDDFTDNDKEKNNQTATTKPASTKSHIQKHEKENNNENIQTDTFLESRKILTITKRPKKKFTPPFIAGNLLKQKNQKTLKDCNSKKTPPTASTTLTTKPKIIKQSQGNNNEPSTSGTNKKGVPINVEDGENDDFENTDEDEVCCVCGLWEPEKLREMTSLTFVKWAKCDVCGHWTHLSFCSKEKEVKEWCSFKCPHC